MKNYAIVLGVSKFANAQDLAVCANDANLMSGLLNATKKYTVLHISEDVNKHQALEQISTFLKEPNSEEEISEVLFYYSGHGYQDKEMHYIMTDTDLDAINSTALNNSEIDDVVRKAQPKLYVKIIDACQSGLTYIKDVSPLGENYSLPLSKGFDNCIFLCSSKKTQNSYTGEYYSQFTHAFFNAIVNSNSSTVKYSDIQNYVTDVFQQEQNGQTPYFNTQCDGTEVFCEKTENVQNYIDSITHPPLNSNTENHTNAELVERYLSRYHNINAVQDIMTIVSDVLKSKSLNKQWLAEYYDISFDKNISHVKTSYYNDSSIAKMLYQRPMSENLFVQVTCEERDNNSLFGTTFTQLLSRPISFSPLVHKLPSGFVYSLKAKKAGLPDYDIPFVFVYSPTFFYVFTSTKQYMQKGWDDYYEGKHTKYSYRQFYYSEFSKESWSIALDSWLKDSEEYIEKTLLDYIQ